MHRRFKSKHHKKSYRLSKVIFFFIIILLIIIYIEYKVSKSSNNPEIVERIINATQNNSYNEELIEAYLSPSSIVNSFFSSSSSKEVLEEQIDSSTYQVYIYNTHESETYEDELLEQYNILPNVKTMAYILKDYLNEYNIATYVEEESITTKLKEQNLSYKYSYQISRSIIEPKIKENNFSLIIDLHRDSSSLDKTKITIDDEDYARILFVIGGEYSTYNENYTVSNRLNTILESLKTGISRGIIIKEGEGVNGIYNQDLSSNCILIELGGVHNEIEELNRSIEVLALSIKEYLEGEI